jgi:DNA polymerase III subunit epsilon
MALFGKKPQVTSRPVAPTQYQFAIVDVETTGLDRQTDRIVEIAVIIEYPDRVLYEWTTLLNPGVESAGPTKIHGITDEMVAVAPPFSAIAGDLAYLLTNRLVVAHNAAFDVAFIEQAFHRTGTPISPAAIAYFDTMAAAEQTGLPRKLGTLCAEMGVFYDPHCALDDAKVTLQVLAKLLPLIDPSTFIPVNPPATFSAVAEPQRAPLLSRAGAVALLQPRDLIAAAAFRFQPIDAPPSAVEGYHDRALRALTAGVFTADIGALLIDIAVEARLSASQARDVHQDLLSELFDSALDDNRVSKSERIALENSAAWLGVNLGSFDAWAKAARVRRRDTINKFRTSLKGQTVVFTGRGVHPSNIREALAGFTLSANYRSDALFVVVGSDTTATAAVQAARDNNATILLETDFWRRCGEL